MISACWGSDFYLEGTGASKIFPQLPRWNRVWQLPSKTVVYQLLWRIFQLYRYDGYVRWPESIIKHHPFFTVQLNMRFAHVQPTFENGSMNLCSSNLFPWFSTELWRTSQSLRKHFPPWIMAYQDQIWLKTPPGLWLRIIPAITWIIITQTRVYTTYT